MSRPPVYQWQPTTAQIARMANMDPASVVRFDHNTSPSTPPWVTEVAAHAAAGANEYPGADYAPLRHAIAAYHGLEPEWVVPGAGADELILLVATAYLDPGGTAVIDTPAYPMYRIATTQRGGKVSEVVRAGPRFAPDVAAIAAAAGTAAVTWLCVPHNPLGDTLAVEEILEIAAAATGLVVVDAAYAEFAGDRWSEQVRSTSNLVVLGTMSKAFGLAGARVGYALAHPDVIAGLDAVRPPGSISTVSAALAERGLGDLDWMRANVAAITTAREHLADALRSTGIHPEPSITNFVLAPVGGGARALARRLMETDGLVVRSFPEHHPLADRLRFTARTPDDHDRLADALRRLR